MIDEEEPDLDEEPTVCSGACERCEYQIGSIDCLAAKESAHGRDADID